MKRIGCSAMLVLISGCAIGVPLIESKVAISDDIELEFKEYRYTNDDRAACEKSESHCFKNGIPVFGTESLHPISHLSALELRYKDTRYQLDTSFMYNAGAEKGHQVNGVVEYFYANCYDAKNCIVRGIFSDAGGTYVAEWKVLDGKPFRTILTTAGDIVSKFVDDIRPPVYQ